MLSFLSWSHLLASAILDRRRVFSSGHGGLFVFVVLYTSWKTRLPGRKFRSHNPEFLILPHVDTLKMTPAQR